MSNGFHRRERTSSSMERKHPSHSPRELTLIVCSEESKDYFLDLVDHLELSSQVIVEATSSNNPVRQVEEALKISHQTKPHRRLFLLLDKINPAVRNLDETDQIRQAQNMARHNNLPNNRIFRLILTTPGFPLWLLLHFNKVDFSAIPEEEWLQQVQKNLEEFIPNHHLPETRKDFFNKSHKQIKAAIEQCQKLILIRSIKLSPSSEIHELIGYLFKLQDHYTRSFKL